MNYIKLHKQTADYFLKCDKGNAIYVKIRIESTWQIFFPWWCRERERKQTESKTNGKNTHK